MRDTRRGPVLGAALCLAAALAAPVDGSGSVGDPQLMTTHPWHPGELSCSTFDRLAATEAAVYERETGRAVVTDQDRALAAWYWRNLHWFHNDAGSEDFWDDGFQAADPQYEPRDFWMGLFGYGFSFCGITHAQWAAEMEHLLGHGRARVIGVNDHNSFEVWLEESGWALLDQDLSTVVFDAADEMLLGLLDVHDDPTLIDNTGAPDHNQGWLIAGLWYESPTMNDLYRPDEDPPYFVYGDRWFREENSGYAGAPPMVRLRRGETLRRYLQPGLGGDTYAFWGRHMDFGDVPGPARDSQWVESPDEMYRATESVTSSRIARYANAVFTYAPDFVDGSYREGVVSEDDGQVTFEFFSPYVIAATPPGDRDSWGDWGIYDDGTTNGLVVTTAAPAQGITVQLSTDNGDAWSAARPLDGAPVDLTDEARGHHGYLIRFAGDAVSSALAGLGLTIRTVCQASAATMPHLVAGSNTITYAASGRGVFAAGPNLDQASRYVIEGDFGSAGPVVMEVPSPRGERIAAVYASMWVSSGSPPDAGVAYAIEVSTDAGASWRPVVDDWHLANLGDDPGDSWSQSFVYGEADVASEGASSVQVRFSNDGWVDIRKGEVYLVYEDHSDSPVDVTFAFTDDAGNHEVSHEYPAGATSEDASWTFETQGEPVTRWVEIAAAASTGPDGDADADADADGDGDADADADADADGDADVDADAGPEPEDGCGCDAAGARRGSRVALLVVAL